MGFEPLGKAPASVSIAAGIAVPATPVLGLSVEAAFFVVVVDFFAVVVVLVVVLSVAAAVVVTSACAAVIVNSKRVIQVYFARFGEF